MAGGRDWPNEQPARAESPRLSSAGRRLPPSVRGRAARVKSSPPVPGLWASRQIHRRRSNPFFESRRRCGLTSRPIVMRLHDETTRTASCMSGFGATVRPSAPRVKARRAAFKSASQRGTSCTAMVNPCAGIGFSLRRSTQNCPLPFRSTRRLHLLAPCGREFDIRTGVRRNRHQEIEHLQNCRTAILAALDQSDSVLQI